MKSNILKNILIFIAVTLVASTAAVVLLGAFLSEKLIVTALVEDGYVRSITHSILIVIPIMILLSYIVIKRIIRPIKNITQVAKSIINGDETIRADETIKGEVGYLGRTMNRLSTDLYTTVSQLYVEKNRLHQVLNSLDEGMIAIDVDYKVTHFNQVLLDRFSLESEMVLGRDVRGIRYLEDELEGLSLVIEGGGPIVKKATIDEAILELIFAPIENEKGSSAGAVILFRDITEKVKIETMSKDYVANVSHELRSPLTSIRGLIEPLMDSVVKDEATVHRYHEIIYNESLRLSRLVDDIMELSRLQTNEAMIKMAEVDLESVFEMVYERYRLIDDSIRLIYQERELPRVLSNHDRIEQVLVILLDNAYKFTGDNGEIEISAQEDEDVIMVKVRDTGVGISKEDMPFVFQRFYKSDKPRTQKGTGLGLSIAREILTSMGETITVHSEKGLGSEFVFTVKKYKFEE